MNPKDRKGKLRWVLKADIGPLKLETVRSLLDQQHPCLLFLLFCSCRTRSVQFSFKTLINRTVCFISLSLRNSLCKFTKQRNGWRERERERWPYFKYGLVSLYKKGEEKKGKTKYFDFKIQVRSICCVLQLFFLGL